MQGWIPADPDTEHPPCPAMTWCHAPRAHPDPELCVPCLPLTSDPTLLGGLMLCIWGQHGLP